MHHWCLRQSRRMLLQHLSWIQLVHCLIAAEMVLILWICIQLVYGTSIGFCRTGVGLLSIWGHMAVIDDVGWCGTMQLWWRTSCDLVARFQGFSVLLLPVQKLQYHWTYHWFCTELTLCPLLYFMCLSVILVLCILCEIRCIDLHWIQCLTCLSANWLYLDIFFYLHDLCKLKYNICWVTNSFASVYITLLTCCVLYNLLQLFCIMCGDLFS